MELLPSALVRVRLEGEHQLIAHYAELQPGEFCAFAGGRPGARGAFG